MDGTAEHYLKSSYLGSESQGLHAFSHMKNTNTSNIIYIEIYSKHAFKSGTGREDQGSRIKGKKDNE
jgi:hypothetical protein